MTPWIILAPEKDNVAIALRELGEGEQISNLTADFAKRLHVLN